MQVVDDKKRNPFDLWSRGQKSRSTFAHYVLNLVGIIPNAQSLKNFAYKLWMMSEDILMTLGCWFKGQGNFGTLCIKPCVQKNSLQFMSNHFQTSYVSC